VILLQWCKLQVLNLDLLQSVHSLIKMSLTWDLKYGLSLFEGVFHEEQLACIEQNGVKRYITGLNEFAPEIKMIRDEDQKQARIHEIRSAVSELEKEMAANPIEISDPHFWSKVKLLRP